MHNRYLSLAAGARVASGYRRNRELNAELQAAATVQDSGPWLLVCECGTDGCAETVELTRLEYEAARSHQHLYVVAPGHGSPGITSTVTSVPRRFDLVELRPDWDERAATTTPADAYAA
jgi:hypothetical protein